MGEREIECFLEPSYGIESSTLDGVTHFEAVHTDPQFSVQDKNDGKLRLLPGRYKFEFRGTAAQGRISEPVIYLDYGRGYSEEINHRLSLGSVENGLWCAHVTIPETVLSVRFDPSMDVFVSADLRLSIYRLGSMSDFLAGVLRSTFYDPPRRLLRRAFTTKPQLVQIDPKSHIAALEQDYTARVFTAKGGRSQMYGAMAGQPATKNPPAVLPIAYYLTQMHPIPENDKWWGKGFTEWTNVSKAVPMFQGHEQPKLPGELGFYDLRLPDVMARQIELARLHGLHGFCYYYYWFDGKRLLERPLDMFLSRKDKAFDFPFCLCWANENWTRRWDGAEKEVLMAQSHSPEDHLRVIDDLLNYCADSRYIRVEDKPVILIYRPSIIPDLPEMLKIWRKRAVEKGLPGLFIVSTNSFGFSNAEGFDFDAIGGFPPHGLEVKTINHTLTKIHPNYEGWVFDYAEVVEVESKKLKQPKPNRDKGSKQVAGKLAHFPGVMVAWDNSARTVERGNVFHNSTPSLYRQWLSVAAETTIASNPPDRRFLFINAWNEWAEGTYLEPDRKFGYAYLAATADVVREHSADKSALNNLAKRVNKGERMSDTAICLHIYYPEMIGEFAKQVAEAQISMPMDVILTIPETWAVADAKQAIEQIKPVRFLPCPNRGRDVLPFLNAMIEGEAMGYQFGCKIHSKKSMHLNDGDAWRRRLTQGLLQQSAVALVVPQFKNDTSLALAAPATEFASSGSQFQMRDNRGWVEDILQKAGQSGKDIDEFVAGTMFWFRFSALAPLARLGYTVDDFGPELGQIDGTLAHAFERVFVALASDEGRKVLKYSLADKPNAKDASL